MSWSSSEGEHAWFTICAMLLKAFYLKLKTEKYLKFWLQEVFESE